MITLKFDESNPHWNPSKELNTMFVRYTENYLTEILTARGYLYLNQIYEALGFSWDPTKENKLWVKPDCWFSLNFEVFPMPGESMLIVIGD